MFRFIFVTSTERKLTKGAHLPNTTFKYILPDTVAVVVAVQVSSSHILMFWFFLLLRHVNEIARCAFLAARAAAVSGVLCSPGL